MQWRICAGNLLLDCIAIKHLEKSMDSSDFWSVLQSAHSDVVSPYHRFSAKRWAAFSGDTPLTLTQPEIDQLRSLGDPINLDEVGQIYLPVSRMLSSHVEATRTLFVQRQRFLSMNTAKTPFIIGIAGSVAVGKSTAARLLRLLMTRWPSSPRVDLVTTDGFLLPNAVLEQRDLMNRKGFPKSYDGAAILRFLSDIKAGKRDVRAPLYDHLTYDIMSDKHQIIDQPDILIVEGLNVLQPRSLSKDGMVVPVVSDFFDFSLYLDADETDIHRWYVARFMKLRKTAFADPKSYFHRYSELTEKEALDRAEHLWRSINLPNLRNNIMPTRPRADLVLRKGTKHRIEDIALRKL